MLLPPPLITPATVNVLVNITPLVNVLELTVTCRLMLFGSVTAPVPRFKLVTEPA